MSERPWERYFIDCGLRCAEPCWLCAIRRAAEPDADEVDDFGTVPLRLDAGALVARRIIAHLIEGPDEAAYQRGYVVGALSELTHAKWVSLDELWIRPDDDTSGRRPPFGRTRVMPDESLDAVAADARGRAEP